jgi:hypothetical protein
MRPRAGLSPLLAVVALLLAAHQAESYSKKDALSAAKVIATGAAEPTRTTRTGPRCADTLDSLRTFAVQTLLTWGAGVSDIISPRGGLQGTYKFAEADLRASLIEVSP